MNGKVHDLDETCGTGATFGSSPPNRPFVADSSDLFKAVMQDFKQESRLSNAVIDITYATKHYSQDKTGEYITTQGYWCQRCHDNASLCRCFQNSSKLDLHRVQWIDELHDKPLALEQSVRGTGEVCSSSHITQRRDSVKPILKHKANCITIISE